ncbi:unnamed protein product [Phytophthora lilii]|uniref:Unnamed protein product n=1 Tax=Phytophthora lilii TaxID=2077276 RepID=A0A9W6TDV4_9STRA|nr:unnamed protein product [Phytophthora lilii]
MSSTRAAPSGPLPLAVDPPDSAAAATTVAAVIEFEDEPELATPGTFFGGSIASPVKIGSPYCTRDSGGVGVDILQVRKCGQNAPASASNGRVRSLTHNQGDVLLVFLLPSDAG